MEDGRTSIKVILPYTFATELLKCKGKSIEELVEGFGDSNISFNNGFFMIQNQKAKSLFSEPIAQITSHVKSLMSDSKLKGLSYILLVGGFGGCTMLQDACKKGFPKVKVLIPSEAQLAIIQGAVLFGHNPLQVHSRIARFTYGRAVTKHFKDGVHEPSKKTHKKGKDYAIHCFEVFIKKGEEINTGTMRHFTSLPFYKDQTATSITFYKTEKEGVIHVDERGVTRLATAELQSFSGPLSKIEIRLTCGHTELLVEARDTKQEKEFPIKLTLDFY